MRLAICDLSVWNTERPAARTRLLERGPYQNWAPASKTTEVAHQYFWRQVNGVQRGLCLVRVPRGVSEQPHPTFYPQLKCGLDTTTLTGITVRVAAWFIIRSRTGIVAFV